MTFEERLSANEKKIYCRFIWSPKTKDNMSSGLFTYTKPKSQIERNHNREVLALLEIKRSQLIIERQSIGTGYIPAHKCKNNFFYFYKEYVKKNSEVASPFSDDVIKSWREMRDITIIRFFVNKIGHKVDFNNSLFVTCGNVAVKQH